MRRLTLGASVVLVVVCLLTAAAVALAAPQAGTPPQPRGGERMRGFGDMMFVEHSWATLAFELNATPDQLAKMRPTYQWGWQTRKSAMDAARKSQNFKTMETTMAKVRSTIEARLKIVLTKSQYAKWQTLQKQRPGGPRP